MTEDRDVVDGGDLPACGDRRRAAEAEQEVVAGGPGQGDLLEEVAAGARLTHLDVRGDGRGHLRALWHVDHQSAGVTGDQTADELEGVALRARRRL